MERPRRLTRLIPFGMIIFLNAFVDLGHKILIQNSVFKLYDGQTQIILTALVNGLILLPFVLLLSPAGYLADRHPKPRVMRMSAAVAVALTLLITLAYYQGWFELAFGMTFLLAIQSAFYSPAKYGYIKELVGAPALTKANAAVQAITIVAILSGIFIFSLLFEQLIAGRSYQSEPELLQLFAPLGWLLVACSLIEYLLALKLEPGQPTPRPAPFDWRRYSHGGYLQDNLRLIRGSRAIWLSIIGLSVFWGISQVVLAAYPAFAKESLGLTSTVLVQGLLACSGIGIVAGSLLAGKLSRRHIETGLIPIGAIGVVASLLTLPQLAAPHWLAVNFILLGTAGGLFIVPLNALIQFHARDEQLGTVLAGNNWMQNLVMLGFLGLTLLFSISGTDSDGLLHLVTLSALAGGIYTLHQLPQSLVRLLIRGLVGSRYRVNVLGFEHIPAQGGVLMLGNHISWLDWAMLQIASPRPIRFVMHRDIYNRWYLRWFFDFFGVIPIAGGTSQAALQKINTLLKAGEVVCLFPEGAISRNGQLGEFKRGYERTVEGVEGVILPFYLRGLWGSHFSRSSEQLKICRRDSIRREIIVAFGPSLPLSTQAEALKQKVTELSIEAWEAHSQSLEPIPLAWLRRAKRVAGRECVADARGGRRFSGHRFATAVVAFSRLIARRSPEQNVGLLVPSSSAGLITNMAALLAGKTVVNLNYTAPVAALESAVERAEIRSIYTSRRFIEKLSQRGLNLDRLLATSRVCFLEDMQQEISKPRGLVTLACVKLLPARLLYRLFGRPVATDQAAAILFSSGSEGTPKGVLLSHKNIMGNIKQVSDVLDSQSDERVMATLPLFHAFGLTVTGLMPLIEGIPVTLHPDPTDVVNIAKAIARDRCTLFCATSTFLRLFSRNQRVHPLMFDSLRLVVAGAERLQPDVREAFQLKFNKPIFEGYGTTETTPVASVNIPDRLDRRDWQVQTGNRPGSVGLPLPGACFRIVDPDTLAPLNAGEDGLILIGGTQVMLGYLQDPEKTAEAIVTLDGRRWYKSGDKGHLDSDGFLTIVDRYSRFAKIGGEMISLSAVESAIAPCLPRETEILVTALDDDKKGEKIVLLFSGELEAETVKQHLGNSSLPPLMQPSQLIKLEQIPKLGSGKSDFSAARRLAAELA